MKNFEKFKDESLEINQLVKLRGGELEGGDDSCDVTPGGYTNEGQADEDFIFKHWNDDGTSNGYLIAK